MSALRRRLAMAAACGALWPLAACTSAEGGAPERIVLIVVDTLRQDHLSCYGGTVATPRIDVLAREGLAHPGLTASFHQTSMSMAALFTGRTPSLESGRPSESLAWTGRTWCGLSRFVAPGRFAPDSECIPRSLATLGERLRERGYWTAGVVANRLLFRPAGFHRGFEQWVELPGPEQRAAERARPRGPVHLADADEVNASVRAVLAERPHDRFLLYVHYMDVHDYRPRGRPYAEMVARVDRGVGALLDHLAGEGLLDSATVIFVSDHGERFEESHLVDGGRFHLGNPSFGEVLRVPLIVRPAAHAPSAEVVRSEDLFHHITGLAGAGAGGERDLLPGEAFTSERRWQTYRRGRWKSYRHRPTRRLLLVDLEADPGETRDVAHDHPYMAATHRQRLDALTAALAARRAEEGGPSEEDRQRLRALGYLEASEAETP